MQNLLQDLRCGARRERELVIDEKESTCLRKIAAPLALKFLTALWLLLAFVSSVSVQGQESAPSRALAFTHVTVIDGAGAEARPEFTVVIAGARIVEIGPHQRVRIPQGAQIVDANGKFLIPGLWDMHVHLGEGGASLVLAIIDDKAGLRDARRKYVPQSLADFWRKQIEMKRFEPQIDWQTVAENNRRIFRALHQAGVKIMTGTDLGAPLCYPGFGLHDELELLVNRIGLTPAEALQSATRIPAEFMGMSASLGTIEKGKLADLALLEADPLSDITHTRRISAVVIGGKLFSKAELKAMLEKAAAEAGQR